MRGEPVVKGPHEEVDQIQAVADLAEETKGCEVEESQHPTIFGLPQSQHHREEAERQQRLHVRRAHDVVDRRCFRSVQREQGHHQREADRKHPLPGGSAYPIGGSRRIREHHGAHRTRDQILAADQRNQAIRRLWQERGEQESKGDARCPQHEQPAEPCASRPQEGKQQRENQIELLFDAQRPEVDAIHPHGIPRTVHKCRLDPRVEKDPPVHHVENVCRQVSDADRGCRQSKYQIVGGEDSQCAAHVKGFERLAARPVFRRDQDSSDQESTDHEEQRDPVTAPPEVFDIAVDHEHREKGEEPKSVDLFAMLERLHQSGVRWMSEVPSRRSSAIVIDRFR